MFFYSPSARAFYDARIHGPQTIDIVDHDKLEAALKQLTDRELEGDADLAAIDEARRALIDNPPTQTVPNDACRMPADVIAVSAEDHEALMRAQADGAEIVPHHKTGHPVTAVPFRSAEDLLAAVRAMRDRALAASDFTQLADAQKLLSAAKKKAWAEHRQRLRDLPAQVAKALDAGVPVGDGSIASLLPEAPA